MTDSGPTEDPRQALRTLRLLWGASLAGEVVILGVAIWLQASGQMEADADLGRILAFASVAMLGTVVPAAYFVRNQFYKRWWQGNRITARGYLSGNVALFAMIESVTLVAVVAVLLGGLGSPALYVAIAAIGVELLNYPTGKAMEPTEPRIGERPS